MDSYREDLAELRIDFAGVNVHDSESLRAWFARTPHLTTLDRCRLAGRSISTVRDWRHLAGIRGRPYKPSLQKQRPALPTIEAPEDWNNAEWLAHAYSVTRSIRQVARAVGRSYATIYAKLRRHNIAAITDLKQLHPCRNRKWLNENYVRRKFGKLACAKLAGVSHATISGWLAEYNIPVRTLMETQACRRRDRPPHVCLWGRKLYYQLKHHPLVTRVRVRDRGLMVNYRTHVKEVYWFGAAETRKRAFSLNKEDARLVHVPPIHQQYPEPFGPSLHPGHLTIERSDWIAASFIEQRIAFHEMHRRLRELRWSSLTFPAPVLAEDLRRLRSYRRGKHLKAGGFVAYRGPVAGPGWAIMLQYFDMYDYFNLVWASPPKLWRAMQAVAETTRPLSTVEIVRSASFLYGPRVAPATLWADIFRQVGKPATVLDMHPGLGARAMACAILGLRYRTAPNERFERAMASGLGELLGLDWAVDDGGRVDLVVADDGFGTTDLGAALAFADRTKGILGFAPHADLKAAARLGSRAVLRVRTRFYSKQDDYLVLW